MKKRIIYFIYIIVGFSYSCKKLVEVEPPANKLVSANVYATDITAASVATGMYSTLSGFGGFSGQFGLTCGLSADELTYYSTGTTKLYYTNSLVYNSSISFWSEIYQKYIYTCNDMLTNLPNSKIDIAVSNQLIGEAKFTRAFFNFYLTNGWGSIPLLTSTDYSKNSIVAKTDTATVYSSIIQDLKDSQQVLNKSYVGTDALSTVTDRTFPNYWAATALLARVYLYQRDYSDAFSQSDALIKNTTQYNLQSNLNNVFKGGNNQEAIWQLAPNKPNYDTYDAYYYILTKAPASNSGRVTLSNTLISAFETGDNRRTNWVHDTTIATVKYSYAYKYKINYPTTSTAEYTTVLRLAEQYLIRAEAQANGAGTLIPGALADLNVIRNRAGLPNYSGLQDKASVLTAIMHERQVELFTEFGHRWFDLKRTGQVNLVMGGTSANGVTSQKGGIWYPYDALWPIPYTDIVADPNLKQNPGY